MDQTIFCKHNIQNLFLFKQNSLTRLKHQYLVTLRNPPFRISPQIMGFSYWKIHHYKPVTHRICKIFPPNFTAQVGVSVSDQSFLVISSESSMHLPIVSPGRLVLRERPRKTLIFIEKKKTYLLVNIQVELVRGECHAMRLYDARQPRLSHLTCSIFLK